MLTLFNFIPINKNPAHPTGIQQDHYILFYNPAGFWIRRGIFITQIARYTYFISINKKIIYTITLQVSKKMLPKIEGTWTFKIF